MNTKILALVLVLISSSASSQTIFGGYDCGKWMAGPQPARSWLLGYLSGINYLAADMSKTPKFDPLDKISSAEQTFLWMDNYCRANPLNTVTQGANDLYKEILKK